jgi:O-antigen ligase
LTFLRIGGGKYTVSVILLLLICLIPIIPFNFIYLGQSHPILSAELVRYIPFFIIVLCLFFVKNTIFSNVQNYSFIETTIVAYICCIFLGAIASVNPFNSIAKAIYFIVTGELLIWVVLYIDWNSKCFLKIFAINVVICSYVACVTIAEMMGFSFYRKILFTSDNPLMSNFIYHITQTRAIASIGNPNPLGTYLAASCPFFLFWIIRGKNWQKGFSLLGLLILIIAIYFTFSRAAWITGTLVILIYLSRYYINVVPYILVIAIFLGLLLKSDERLQNRDSSTQYELLNYSNHRILSIDFAIRIWQKQPLLGVGLGNYSTFSRPLGSALNTPDNMFLLTLAESGLMGLFFRISLWFGLSHCLIKALLRYKCKVPPNYLKRSNSKCEVDFVDIVWVMFLSLSVFILNMISWDVLAFPVTRILFWIYVGLSLAVLRDLDKKVIRQE